METLLAELAALGLLDWLATLTALAYVLLAARDNNWCWLFAAISSACWAYQSYAVYSLVSDSLLQVFYFVMAGVGLWRWRRGTEVTAGEASIRSMTMREHLMTNGLGLGGGLLLGLVFSNTLQAAATYPDAITTVYSVVATFLLISRRLENWLYWIVIDAAYVWIYGSQGALLFAGLMVLYVGLAVYGYFKWRGARSTPSLPSAAR